MCYNQRLMSQERPIKVIEPVVPEKLVPLNNKLARFNFEIQYYEPLQKSHLTIVDLNTDGVYPSEGIIDEKSAKLGTAEPLAYFDIDLKDKRPIIHLQQEFFSQGHTQIQRQAALRYLTFKACFLGAPKLECDIYIDPEKSDTPIPNEYDLASLLKYVGHYLDSEFEMVLLMIDRGADGSENKK